MLGDGLQIRMKRLAEPVAREAGVVIHGDVLRAIPAGVNLNATGFAKPDREAFAPQTLSEAIEDRCYWAGGLPWGMEGLAGRAAASGRLSVRRRRGEV